MLAGQVRLPASLAALIANQGAGIVSNNGAAVVSNNGGSLFARPRFQLAAALGEVAVAGAVVELIDARGMPLVGPDGKPWRATTGSDGRFELRGALPDANLLVAVDLGAKGVALAAIVRGGGDVLTIDTVSSLTAGYILDQYVRSQADPLATFDRLTPKAEADTRREAAGALGLSTGVGLDSLLPAAVVSTVETLRREAPGLNGQLEVVRKLLIAAGQADQGNGQVATQVALDVIGDVATAPDGTVYFSVYHQNRIFRLRGERLEAVAGTGVAGSQDPDTTGQIATEVALDHASDVLVEASGTLVFRDGAGTVWRIQADGRLARLHVEPGGNLGIGLLAGPKGEVWAAYEHILESPSVEGTGGRSRYHVVAIGSTGAREVAAWEAPHGVQEVAGDPTAGMLWSLDRQGRRRLDLARGGQPGPYDGVVPQGARWTFDDAGTVYLEDQGLVAWPPGAATGTPLLTELHGELSMASGFPVHRAADGTRYFRDFNSVYRLRAGTITRVAGTGGQGGQASPTSGDASTIAIESPGSIVAGSGGLLYVADNGASRVLKYAPGKAVEFLSDTQIPNPGWLRLGPNGTLYVLHDDGGNGGPAIYRYGAAGGQAEVVFEATALGPTAAIADFAVTPAGALVMNMLPDEGGDVVVLRRYEPNGQLTVLPAPPTRYVSLALDAAGVPHLSGDGKVWRLAGAAWSELGRFTLAGAWEFRRLVLDAKGRCYTLSEAGGRGAVVRLDPATGQSTLVAGQGGLVLGGTRPDDSLGFPLDDLTISPDGDMYVSDRANRQVKRAPAAALN
jgi:hypothetical protein